ncbi:MAG TPA: hypothetical protein VGM92_09370 [Candidatus Kapabacteria bacterium]
MTWLLSILFVSGCVREPAPIHIADSATTAKSVQALSKALQGKPMRTFRGPADILGDTAKNMRHPALVREK